MHDPNSDCRVGVQDFEPVRLRIKTKYKRTKTEKPDPNYPRSNAEGERRQNRNKPAAKSTHGTAMGSPNVGPQDRPKWEYAPEFRAHSDDTYRKNRQAQSYPQRRYGLTYLTLTGLMGSHSRMII